MASVLAEHEFVIEFIPPIVSKPYLKMTHKVMHQFSATSELGVEGENPSFSIAPSQNYRARRYSIEPDASAASYFWGAAAICGGRATVKGLSRESLQGDIGFVNCLEQMGCVATWKPDEVTVEGRAVRGIDVDMSDISDTAQTLSVVALFAQGPTTIRGVAHNRVKETDRIGNLAKELRKLGATVEEQSDGLTIIPGPLRPAEIETYNDHRMAMSLSLAGLIQPGIIIRDPSCTSKTYPEYFADLQSCLGR